MLLETQEPEVFYGNFNFFKLTVVMWPHIVEKVAVFGRHVGKGPPLRRSSSRAVKLNISSEEWD